MIVITSISPNHVLKDQQAEAINSWLKLGLDVFSINCRSEKINLQTKYPKVTFIETLNTGIKIFNKPYVKINALINFGLSHKSESFMLLNSDIILKYEPIILNKLENISNHSFVYLIRYDYKDNISDAVKQTWGIDGFILNKNNAELVPKANYCMGQCCWDNWLPYIMTKNNVSIYMVDIPFLFHKHHITQWSIEQWMLTAEWFRDDNNVSSEICNTYDHLKYLCLTKRNELDLKTRIIEYGIHDKIKEILKDIYNPVIFKLDSNIGRDTLYLSFIKGSEVHTFESSIDNLSIPENVLISNFDCITLDDYCFGQSINNIDFLWINLQGIEEIVFSGKKALKNTRYIYTNYSNNEILELLPDWSVVELFKDTETNVLLKNNLYS